MSYPPTGLCDLIIHESVDIEQLFEIVWSFAGFPLLQSYSSLFLLEQIFLANHDITRVVELGTGCGGLALFFGVQMFKRKGKVLTLDIKPHVTHFQSWLDLAKVLNVEFREKDAWKQETINEVAEFTGSNRALLFVDGDNKPLETNLYVPIMKPNDLVMSHDHGGEASQIDPEMLNKEVLSVLEPYRQEEFDMLKTMILSYRKK